MAGWNVGEVKVLGGESSDVVGMGQQQRPCWALPAILRVLAFTVSEMKSPYGVLRRGGHNLT